jgi:hypothetical protein
VPLLQLVVVQTRSAKLDAVALAAMIAIALAAYLAMNHLMVRSLVAEFPGRGLLKSSVYGLWIACGFAVFTGVLLTARAFGVAVLCFVACFSVAINYAYRKLLARTITPDSMQWMAHEVQRVPQAWEEFMPEILAALGKALLLVAIFLVLRALAARNRILRGGWITRPFARIAALAAFLGFHGAIMLIQPTYAANETNVIVFGLPVFFERAPAHGDIPSQLQATPRVQKIVLVIDESVNHEVFTAIVAPRLRELPVYDFGEAASTSACSAPSNALLRWGVERSRATVPGYDPRANPSIWKFARAAGYRTVLIDGQSVGLVHNYISSGELALIDEFIPAATGVQSDHRIAEQLNRRLQKPGSELILVVKRGSHIPYEQNYPDGMIARDAPKTMKYAAAVHFAAGGFFHFLTKGLTLADVLLIYTSDHGQNIEARVPHCSQREHPSEYSVPLLVLSEAPAIKALLSSALPDMRGRASHLNVFPTLLYGLGYPREWIDATYGPTLAGPAAAYVRVGRVPYPSGGHSAQYVVSPRSPADTR